MALQLVLRNTDFYQYRSCEGNWIPFPPGAETGYHGWCGTGQQYFESILLFDSFVYDAAIDRYRFITANNIANWPSWEYSTSIIHPETGAEEERIPLVGYAVAHAWTGPCYNGGLNKIYAWRIEGKIVEVMLPDGIPTQTMLDNPLVTVTQVPALSASNFGFALSPERKMFTLLSGTYGIVTYDYSTSPTATQVSRWPFPESFGWSVGYESDERCWMLFSGSIYGSSNDARQTLLKYNYLLNRMELCTELQSAGAPDRMAMVAWDTKRKKLGVVRIKNDEPTGKHNNAFEIYSPHVAITQVTVPVNLKPMSKLATVPLVSHILGTKGEVGGLKEVTISASPTATLIKTPKQVTEANGRVEFEIIPPIAGASESISVSYDETKVVA